MRAWAGALFLLAGCSGSRTPALDASAIALDAPGALPDAAPGSVDQAADLAPDLAAEVAADPPPDLARDLGPRETLPPPDAPADRGKVAPMRMAVAALDDGWRVLWLAREGPDDARTERIWFSQLGPDGSRLEPDVVVHQQPALPSYNLEMSERGLLWNGSQFGALWHERAENGAVALAQLDDRGHLLAPPVRLPHDQIYFAALAWQGDRWGVLMAHDGDTWALATIGTDGRVLDDRALLPREHLHIQSQTSRGGIIHLWTGAEHAVVTNGDGLWFHRLSPAGEWLGPPMPVGAREALPYVQQLLPATQGGFALFTQMAGVPSPRHVDVVVRRLDRAGAVIGSDLPLARSTAWYSTAVGADVTASGYGAAWWSDTETAKAAFLEIEASPPGLRVCTLGTFPDHYGMATAWNARRGELGVLMVPSWTKDLPDLTRPFDFRAIRPADCLP